MSGDGYVERGHHPAIEALKAVFIWNWKTGGWWIRGMIITWIVGLVCSVALTVALLLGVVP